MKTGGAMLIIAVGLLALWIVITGRLVQLQQAWNTLNGQPNAAVPGSAGSVPVPGLPGVSIPVPTIPTSYGVSALPIPTINI